MGRHAAGWTLRLPEGRHIYLVRFQHEGRTVERSTSERDRGAATKIAAAIYGRVVTGQAAPLPVSEDLVSAMAAWLADYASTHTPETAATVEAYVRGFLRFFEGFDRMTEPGFTAYMRERTAAVSRSTLRKEMSALRVFAAWAKAERGIVLPVVPRVPTRGNRGVRGKPARRRQATVIAPEDVSRLLAAIPIKGPRSGNWVRPFFALMWETALRPYSTIAKLQAPLHYQHEAETLFVAREIDKARYERTIPLTAGAREALDLVCPKGHVGALFPHVDKDAMRESLAAAVRASGVAGIISVYDWRHSRISQLANSGAPLAGVAFLVGHKHVSTTSIYVHASAAAGAMALAAVDGTDYGPRRASKPSPRTAPQRAPQRPKKGRPSTGSGE
jgi:integrase